MELIGEKYQIFVAKLIADLGKAIFVLGIASEFFKPSKNGGKTK